MVNINKILITHINLSDNGYLPSLDLFDYYIFYESDEFIGLTLTSLDILNELQNSGPHKTYDLKSFSKSNVPNRIKTLLLDYIGFNFSADGILDLILEPDIDEDRKFYLKSVLYYKASQEGKELQTYNLKVKHFDDLVYYFAEDFVEYKILNNNDDFSESEITLKTYLKKSELKDKFKNYLI
jgi:hypothetical protein